MQILGYSERGIVNALLCDILHTPSRDRHLELLLNLAHFPAQCDDKFEVDEAEVLIEQSFSDFGDADAVFLIKKAERRTCLFMEAKVKGSQTRFWSVEEEFREFSVGLRTQLPSSNLFTQLYHKSRMMMALHRGGIQTLVEGIEFPSCSSKPIRRIGDNPVVRSAVSKIKPFAESAYYLAVLPDTRENLKAFFGSRLAAALLDEPLFYETHHYGYLSWADVESFCRQYQLNHALRVFELNINQICGLDRLPQTHTVNTCYRIRALSGARLVI